MNIFTFLQVRLQQILFTYTEVKESKKQSTVGDLRSYNAASRQQEEVRDSSVF
jgi:hypothetical protein